MPGIIGPIKSMRSSVPPLVAHLAHLRYLTNTKVAADILRDRFGQSASRVRESAPLIAAHVSQALEFHAASQHAPEKTRPVLQYYCYLNLAVAVILAYRPPNFGQYKRHGVRDATHKLKTLDLSSPVVTVNRGAVPLFHAILSDAPLAAKTFRLGHLAAGFHLLHNELSTNFGKRVQAIEVIDRLEETSGSFHSVFDFRAMVGGSKISSRRLEEAMPLLQTAYSRQRKHLYRSRTGWTSDARAMRSHKANGMKIVNFGGHVFGSQHFIYSWRGVYRVPLIPTLTSILLMAFSLASVARYRPALLQSAIGAPVYLLVDTFVQEADGVFVPAVRNLLYREEVAIGSFDYL